MTVLSDLHPKKTKCSWRKKNLCLLATLFLSSNTFALDYTIGETDITFDTTLSLGAAWRVQDQDPVLLANVNGDDGNRNYDTGLISALLKGNSELDIRYRNFGFFARGVYFYDFENAHNDKLSKRTQELVGRDAEILDAYVSGSFKPYDKSLNIRLGKQVVNWGEALFAQNGISASNAIDLSKLRLPGSELKEALIPVPMFWGSLELTENLSLEGMYIADYERIQLEACGSYFSTTDLLCEGDFSPLNLGFASLPVLGYNEASDGEFGVALRWLSPALNDTEFGFYYMQHHWRAPIISAFAPPAAGPGLVIDFPEDVDLFGVSFNTDLQFAGVSLSGEYAHRTNAPLQLSPQSVIGATLRVVGTGTKIEGFERFDVGQLTLGGAKDFASNNPIGADNVQVLAEVTGTKVYDMPSASSLALAANAGDQQPDSFSWGYQLRILADYFNAIGPVSLRPTLALSHDVKGTSPAGGNFVEERKAATLGMTATYLISWSADLAYTNFFGAGDDNNRHDRDFIAATVRYSF